MGGQYSHLVFQPTEESSYDESLEGLEWVDISLSPSEMEENQETQTVSPPTSPSDNNKENVRMPILYYEWKSKEGDKAQHTLLYSPTTAGQTDMGKHVHWLKILRDTLHVNVLCYEYSGYGLFRSSKPSEKHCYENIRAAYNFLTITKQIPSNQIVLMGKALGCGPVVNLASNLYLAFESTKNVKRSIVRKVMKSVTTKELSLFRGFAGVVLQSPMTSVIDLSSDSKFSFIGQITNNMFEVIDKVGKIKCPLFLLHGSADDVIEISHSQKIAKTAAANLWKFFVIESGGHNNLETEYDDEFLEEFVNFIQSLAPSNPSNSKLKRSPSMVPAQYVSPDQVLNRWLSSFGCEKYGSLFIGGGYCDMLVVRSMDQVDLDIIAITDQTDRDTLLSEIGKLREMDVESIQQMSIFWEEDTPRERKPSTSSTGSSSLLEEDEEIAEIRRRVSNADIHIIETRRDKERRVSNADVIKEAGIRNSKKKQSETIDVVTRKRSNSDEGKKKLGGREDRHESITHFIRTRFKRDKSKKTLNGGNSTGTGSSSGSSSTTSSSIDSLYGGTTGSMDMKAMLSLASSGLGLDTTEGGSLKLSNSPSNSPKPLRTSRRLSVSDSPSLDLDRHLSDI